MKIRKVSILIVAVMLLSTLVCFQLVACNSNDKVFKEIVSCAKIVKNDYKQSRDFSITDNCGYKVVTGNTSTSGTYIVIPFKTKDLLYDIEIVDIAFFCNGELLGYKGDYPYSYNASKKDRYLKALNIYTSQDFDKQYSAKDLNKKI